MEERLRFDGQLNLSQANLPEGDYSDARNMVISEGPDGNAGAFKKMSSIDEFANIPTDATEVLAATGDESGNQFILYKSTADRIGINLQGVTGTIQGTGVSQSNGATGVVYSGGVDMDGSSTYGIRLIQTSSTSFTDSLPLITVNGNGTIVSTPSVLQADEDLVNIVKIDTSGDSSMIVSYRDEGDITISVPDFKLLDKILLWNYYGDGVPMSWSTDISYRFMSTDVNDSQTGWETKDLFLIKDPPGDLYTFNPTNTGLGTEYLFQENGWDIAARYVFITGEVSVLSFPIHIPADKNSDTDTWNVTIDGGSNDESIVQVEWYASRNGGPYRRVETKPTGVSGVNPRNLVFTGQQNEALSTTESSKLFDSVPITAQTIEINSNRVFLGNMVDDLASEDGDVALSVTLNVVSDDFTVTSPSSENTTEEKPFSYIGSGNDRVATAWTEKHLTNDSLYKIGVMFMDKFFRTRGVHPSSINNVQTAQFGVATKIDEITMTSSSIPSWAEYAKVVMTNNLTKDFSIEAYANSIFFQLEDNDGTLYFSNVAPEGQSVDSIVIDAPISYSFQEGDRVNLIGDDGSPTQIGVKSVVNGLIFCEPTEDFKIPKQGGEDNYIEIFSPKSIADDEFSVFYEIGRVFRVTPGGSLNETFGDDEIFIFGQRHYDQYFESQRFRPSVFSSHIDEDTGYFFSANTPVEQPGMPVPIKGAVVFLEDDASKSIGTSDDWFVFDAVHSNSHRQTFNSCYRVNDAAHGHAKGDIVDVPTGTPGTHIQRIVKVIDSNNYYATVQDIAFSVVSAAGFSANDFVTLTHPDQDDDITCWITRISGTTIHVTGLTTHDRNLDSLSWGNISNGTSTTSINNTVASSTGIAAPNYDLTNGALPFSEEKIYAANLDDGDTKQPGTFTSVSGEDTSVMKYNVTYDMNGVALPAKDGRARIFYDIRCETTSGSFNDPVELRIEVLNGSDVVLGVLDSADTFEFSGIIDIELDATQQTGVSLVGVLDSGSTNTDVNLLSGSYILANLEEDIVQTSIASNKEDQWGLCRKPNRIRNNDFYWDRPRGRGVFTDRGNEPRTLDNKIRWGARFVEDSLFNPISSFNTGDQEFVSEESGPITSLITTNKIDSIGSVLLAICERETNSIYINERLVTNNDGSSSLALSDAVVGSIQPLQGSHGCKHKRSIVKDQNGHVAWWDDFNKDIIRYSREGLVAISDYKVKPFFQSESGEVISMYDKFHDMFFFYMKDGSGETISYRQGVGWVGFHDFQMDIGGVQYDDKAFPIFNDKIWQTLGSNYGSYMGAASSSSIKLSKFMQQNFEPKFMRARGNLQNLGTYSVNPITFVFSNDVGQQTTLSEGFFVIDGSYLYSDVYLDENSGGITDGLPLLGSTLDIDITLGSDQSTSQALKELYLGYQTMTY